MLMGQEMAKSQTSLFLYRHVSELAPRVCAYPVLAVKAEQLLWWNNFRSLHNKYCWSLEGMVTYQGHFLQTCFWSGNGGWSLSRGVVQKKDYCIPIRIWLISLDKVVGDYSTLQCLVICLGSLGKCFVVPEIESHTCTGCWTFPDYRL